MAVCKRCGCAIPIGSKTCDMCATAGAIAPSSQVWQPPSEAVWQPPKDAAPVQWASTASSWARGAGTTIPAGPASTEVLKAEKNLKWAWQAAAFVGAVNVGLGAFAELAPIPSLLRAVNWGSAVEGAVYIVLAYFIRRASKLAVGITLALLGLDALFLVLAGQVIGVGSPVRIVIFLAVLRGLSAIDVLRRRRVDQETSQARAA